ncbi:hypothetical protein [Glaciihabitans sp. dw_435]|uniref:hypothetical protein n=1 Tax=Glaciihabitans sp. dw_435 TaxID=2720081 RepID=UPI001BD3DFC9|nr:hypothetical protein [Glaciihabitans sp. dw_435]
MLGAKSQPQDRARQLVLDLLRITQRRVFRLVQLLRHRDWHSVGGAGPIVIAIVAIVLEIRRGVRRRRFSSEFPLAAFLAVIIPFFVGDLIATASNHMAGV